MYSKVFSVLGIALVGLTSCSTTPQSGTAIELFNGTDVQGWDFVLKDPNVPKEKVWQVKDGILVCQGEPIGAIYRGPAVTNFRLAVEYRWPATPGNSGIFSRIEKPATPLPRAVEVQLKHGSAGDVLGLQGKRIEGGQDRFFEVKKHAVAGDISGVNKLADAEKPAGQWNKVEILAQGSRYVVWMNGQQINDVKGVSLGRGPIGLQSEGGAIEFRRVTLVPLD